MHVLLWQASLFDIICTVALSVTFAFLLANDIPLYEYSIFYLSI